MAIKISNATTASIPKDEPIPVYVATPTENDAKARVMEDFITGRNIVQKSYNQLNGRNIYDAIDDWTMRWNGYLIQKDIINDNPTSSIFLNFTRNVIISYLAKVAMNPPKAKILAVNRKSNLPNIRLAEILEDLYQYSQNAENGPARFLEAALECVTKGTVIIYEGYAKNEQKEKTIVSFDAQTGEYKYEEKKRIIFDNCFQEIVPVEDLYISNPYEANIQKQPYLIWRKITTYDEAKTEYGHYANFEYIKPGNYTLTAEPTTFYRNKLYTELNKNQVEILKYYCRKDNLHILLINGVAMYQGPIPRKDGKYPFAKGIFEPFGNDFFWGASMCQKFMGDQDLINTLWNMMIDKTYGSLLPYGLSSDLDDLIEDNVLAPNKIRKVSDITKWKFDTLPGISGGEENMMLMAMNMARENSGEMAGGGSAQTQKGQKVTARQALLKQQEMMQKMEFSLNFLEDLERDRIELRINSILQFYSIPKLEKITGKRGKEIEQLVYRDIQLTNADLSDGKSGTRYIKLVGEEAMQPDNKVKLENDLSVIEAMGEITGTPTEAVAIVVDTFYDYNYQIQVIKNSSYEKNQMLDQAVRHEYATWRLQAQALYGVPVDAPELIKWVDESYDIDTERFTPKPGEGKLGMPGQPALPGQGGQPRQTGSSQGAPGGVGPATKMQPSNIKPPGMGVMIQ